MGTRTAIPVLALLSALAALHAQEGPTEIPSRVGRELERAATELAKCGRGREVDEVLAILEDISHPAAEAKEVRDDCEARLAKTSGPPRATSRAAKHLRKAAAELVKTLATAPPAERERLAGLVLRIDGTREEAHETLGHVRHEGRWMSKEAVRCLPRRAEIADALRRARTLTFSFTRGESDLPVFKEVYGKKGRFVRWKNLSLHSRRLTSEKLERLLTETLRAAALAWFLHEGTLDFKLEIGPYPVATLGSREDYQKAVDAAARSGGLTGKEVEWSRELAGFFDRRGHQVHMAALEAHEEAGLFFYLYTAQQDYHLGGRGQPCLSAGLASWVCLSYIGTRMPGFAWPDSKGRIPPTRSVTKRELEEFRTMLRLSEAGIAGSRSWIAWLAARGEDPPWAAAMQPEVGQIVGDALLKTTFVSEYLFETGEFPDLYASTRTKGEAKATIPQLFEEGLGEKLPDLEKRWRSWIIPVRDGLQERVSSPPASAASPEVTRLLKYLIAIRRAATETMEDACFADPRIDSTLSAGCKAHALYLDRHPDQLAAWPDAHEEYPDREGFTPAGSLAGLSSVIAPGVTTPEEAVDGWMGTWFHRLPLLHPGLLRVGWALVGKVAVLDAGSLVAPAERVLEVVWPPDGAKDVPLRFNPEIPNPFPGKSQAEWGYPVTLQLFHYEAIPELTLELREGEKNGDVVPSLLSTPNRPGNPELVPKSAFCLIPVKPLKPGTKYTVRVVGFPKDPDWTWSFRTGGGR